MGSRDLVEDQQLDRMRAAVRASPRSTAFVALAHALCDAGLAAEAEVVSRQGLAHHPDLPTGQVALARAWLEGGTPARAERALRETIRHNPRHADAYRWLAETLNRTGRAGEAAEIWPRARTAAESRHTAITREQRRLTDSAATVKLPTPEPTPPLPPLSPRLTPLPSPEPLPLPLPHHRDEEPTPTGSFPPISVTQDATKAVSQHDRRRWSLWIGLSVVVASSALGAFFGLRHAPSAPTGEPVSALRADLEADLHAGTLKRLLRARDNARSHLTSQPADEVVRVTLASVLAQLAYQHGIDVANDELVTLTTPQVERMVGTVGALGASDAAPAPPVLPPSLGARREAALALRALARGNREEATRRAEKAAASAPEDLGVVLAVAAARYRAGDVAGAITTIEQRPGPATGGPSGAMRLLLAAAHIDRGVPSAAAAVLQPILGESEDGLAMLLAIEGRAAWAKPEAGAGVTTAVRDATCLEESPLSPVVAAACALDAGIARRLFGDRAGALAKAREVGKTGITDPRVLGTTAQLLANLGEIDEAAAVVAHAARHAATSLPAIAWAQLGVRIGRSEVGRPAKHLLAVGSESRLVAARAALANGDDMGLTEAAVALDPDLRWLATLARATERRDAALFSDRLETEQPNPGPVGAYVAGMMARRAGRRHLAERWLQQALTGHGDTCRAAREYKETQRQLRRDEWRSDADLPLEAHNKRCRID